MGVPAFFRWLTTRYPKVVINALSEDDIMLYAEEFANEQRTKNKMNPDSNEIDLEGDIGLDKDLMEATAMNQKLKEKSAVESKIKANNP